MKHRVTLREHVTRWIAWHLPRDLVNWAAIRLIAYATQGRYGSTVPDDLSVMDALRRWQT